MINAGIAKKWIGLAVILSGILIYSIFIRNLVFLAYADNEPEWFNSFIHTFYPRFFVERDRFSADFFLQKTDLMVGRISLVFILIIFWGPRLYNKVFVAKDISFLNFKVLRVILFGVAPFYYWDWITELIHLGEMKDFYAPVLFLSPLFPNYPSAYLLAVIFALMILSNLLSILNKQLLFSGLCFALCFITLEGFFLSFHKLDHGFATYIYCLLIFPWMGIVKQSKENTFSDAWPIRLIWVSITLSYFMSGMEKLTISGWHWVMPETIQGYLSLHHTPLGDFVAHYDFLCVLMAVLGLSLQLGFVSVLFKPKLVWVFVPAGLIFHFLTGQMFQIAGWISPWQVVYVFFVDWKQVLEIFSNKGFLYKMINTKNG